MPFGQKEHEKSGFILILHNALTRYHTKGKEVLEGGVAGGGEGAQPLPEAGRQAGPHQDHRGLQVPRQEGQSLFEIKRSSSDFEL